MRQYFSPWMSFGYSRNAAVSASKTVLRAWLAGGSLGVSVEKERGRKVDTGSVLYVHAQVCLRLRVLW